MIDASPDDRKHHAFDEFLIFTAPLSTLIDDPLQPPQVREFDVFLRLTKPRYDKISKIN